MATETTTRARRRVLTPWEKLRRRYPLAKEMVATGTASPQLRLAVDLLLEGRVIREVAEIMGLSRSHVFISSSSTCV